MVGMVSGTVNPMYLIQEMVITPDNTLAKYNYGNRLQVCFLFVGVVCWLLNINLFY